MSVWREVQELLYERWATQWADTTPFAFSNEPMPDLGDPPVTNVRLRVDQRPGGPATLGRPGQRLVDRRGAVYAIFRAPPGGGVGGLSDLGEKAQRIFEGQRFDPNDIRFEVGSVSPGVEVDGGTWWGFTVEVPFSYGDII